MAYIRKRGPYQWQCEIRRKGWPPQSKTFETRADAEVWARDIEREMDRGTFVSRSEAEKTTLYAALQTYEKQVSKHKKGYEQESKRIAAWQANELANRSLASLSPGDFAKFRDKRLAAGAKAATVRLDLALISHLFTIAAKEWGMHLQNPVRQIRRPTANNARDRRLTQQEEQYLLAAVDDPGPTAVDHKNVWIPSVVRLAIETATRQGELLTLLWKDVDLESRTAILRDTKNGETRAIPLSTRAKAALEGLPRSKSGQVFPVSATAIRQSWRRAVARARRRYAADCRAAGDKPAPEFLKDLRYHDLRHEGTSRLFEKGLNPIEAAAVTGHKDTRMLKRYTHLRAEDLAKKLG